MEPKILLVDDEPNVLSAIERNLKGRLALDPQDRAAVALERLRADPGSYGVLLVDMRMPEMDGIEFLEKAAAIAPDAVPLMLTGNNDLETAVAAVNRGHVFQFLTKPCATEVLETSLRGALNVFGLRRAQRELLEGTLNGCVKMLAEILGMVAPHALGRGQRLQQSMARFARHINAPDPWELELAALLSPIGYASLPTNVLRKLALSDPLDGSEERLVNRMPEVGYNLLAGIPRLSQVATIVRYQAKRFDGGGVPQDKVSGSDIPLGARMLRILDDRDLLETDGVVGAAALKEMSGRGGIYDPKLLEACFACFGTFLASTIAAHREVRTLKISELAPGLIVVSDLTTQKGIRLIGSGTKLTPMMLERLRNYHELGDVREPVYVQDGPPDA